MNHPHITVCNLPNKHEVNWSYKGCPLLSFSQNVKSSFILIFPVYSGKAAKIPNQAKSASEALHALLPTHMGTRVCVCVCVFRNVGVCTSMCGLYPLVPALPFWPALPLQLFPALGYIPGESPGAEQLPAAPLLTHIPLFFFFTPFLLSLGLSLSLSL